MKILQVNKFDHFVGGTEKYFLELSELLTEHGHEVMRYSLESEYGWRRNGSFFSQINLFINSIYSFKARKQISILLDKFKPDIVHIHNIYNSISPSVLYEFKKRNIPCVQTVHDYHLISPNVILFHNGKVCEEQNIFRMILHKCFKDSFLLTFAVTIIFAIHKLSGSYSRNISLFLTPSKFMKSMLIKNNFEKKRIKLLPLFVNPVKKNIINRHYGKYVLYHGQFYSHKGIITLLEAARRLPNIEFKLAGGGEEDRKLKEIVSKWNLKNVVFLGFLEELKLKKYILNSRFVVVPSLWYENLPYSILTSFSFGKPVIASNIGGIPEIVRNGINGLLFEPRNALNLAEKVQYLWMKKDLCFKLGMNAFNFTIDKYGSENHYKKLISEYNMVIKKND